MAHHDPKYTENIALSVFVTLFLNFLYFLVRFHFSDISSEFPETMTALFCIINCKSVLFKLVLLVSCLSFRIYVASSVKLRAFREILTDYELLLLDSSLPLFELRPH